jgi:hypothetical protein
MQYENYCFGKKKSCIMISSATLKNPSLKSSDPGAHYLKVVNGAPDLVHASI